MASSDRVSLETVSKAVDSLLKWRKSQSETQKPKLFDAEEEFVYLILTLKKIPQKGRVNPHKIPLPHSLLSQFSEQCLILDDRPKQARITKPDAQKKIQSESIPISKILKLSKLASDYRPFEAKRKLCNSFDLFFADKAVVPLLPRLLGKQFFKKRKIPVPLDLKKRNWKEQVEKACSSAMLFLRTGTCSVLKVAKLSMERDEVVENVVAAIDGVVEIVPKKWANVRSFHLKLLDSVALPVYQVVPDVRLKIEGAKDEEEATAALEKKKEKKKGKEDKEGKKNKKGRIHEVKYMDDKLSEDGDSDGGDDDNGVGEDDGYVNGEKGSDGLVSKKRKKGIKVGKGSASEMLAGVKLSKESAKGSAKRKKKDEGLVKKSEDKVSVQVEGSGKEKKKKKKKRVGVDVKVKAKKSKKAA